MSPTEMARLLAAKRAALDALRAERQALADLLGPHDTDTPTTEQEQDR